MGVRGKIEAVIYAAEEPVTLQQLAALFGEEALAERAAAHHGEGRQMRLQVDAPEPDPDEPDPDAPRPQAEDPQAQPPAPQAQASAPAAEDPVPQAEPSPAPPAANPEDLAAPPPAQQPQVLPAEPYEATGEPVLLGDPDADKRAARLRDREARDEIRRILLTLMAEYDAPEPGRERGMEIREIAGGFRVATKPEYHDAVRAFVKSLKPPMKLTLQALETLAVIAYKQPVTSPEVSEIRGVDSGGVLGSLISRKLVTTAGRKQVVGRPILYKTTREFLLRFGLKDLAELPSMEEFEKMAGELQGLSDEADTPPAHTAPGLETAKTGTPDETGGSTPTGEPPPEQPNLAPAEITVSAAEPELPGLSVDEGGLPIPDPSDQQPPTPPEKAGD